MTFPLQNAGGIQGAPWLAPVIAVLAIWSIVWKGLALWRSAQRGQKVWFIVMLVLNTVGILEIIYLLTAGRRPAKA